MSVMQEIGNYKKGLFPFKPGETTKRAHIEYSQFPRSSEFEYQFYNDTKKIAQSKLEDLKSKKNTDYQAGFTVSTNRALRIKDKERKIPILEDQLKKPYFGRLDIVNEDGGKESIYIGKNGMEDDSHIRIYNIRSSFGAVYNQSKLGPTTHEKLGEVKVNLLRQIENENGNFINYYDKKWDQEEGYLDPVLEKRLNKSAKEKLSEIWETIQAEQDFVMRQKISVPVFVQGSAGSGKTIIALHRISYLLYEYEQSISPDKVLILAPNKTYINYVNDISSEIKNVNQFTFEEYCSIRLPFIKYKYKIADYYDFLKQDNNDSFNDQLIITTKGSLEYKDKLNKFLESNHFLEKCIPKEGLIIEELKFNFSFDRIRDLFKRFVENTSITASKKRILNIIKQEAEVSSRSRENKITSKEFKALVDRAIKKLEKDWKLPNVFEIYVEYCTNIENIEGIIEEDKIKTFIQYNRKNESNKLVTFDDLPALLFIQHKAFEGIGVMKKVGNKNEPTHESFDYVLVDEVQDYSPFHIFIIQQFVKSSRMTLLGDLGQGIFYPRGIDNWKNVFNSIQVNNEQDYKYIELGTIYRSTLEIVNYANLLLKPFSKGRYTLSNPVGREGSKPEHHRYKSIIEQLTKITELCKELKKESYESIAIITKDWEEAYALYSGLRERNKSIQLFDEESKGIKSGIFVSPVYLIKGFEYDAVIIANASREIYTDSFNTRKLLYVAVTRALHKVHVLFRDNLAIPLLEIINPADAKRLKEEIQIDNRLKEEISLKITNSKEQILGVVENQLNTIFKQQAEEIYELKKKIMKLEKEANYYKSRTLNKDN